MLIILCLAKNPVFLYVWHDLIPSEEGDGPYCQYGHRHLFKWFIDSGWNMANNTTTHHGSKAGFPLLPLIYLTLHNTAGPKSQIKKKIISLEKSSPHNSDLLTNCQFYFLSF